LALAALALALASRRVVPQQTSVEERPSPGDPAEVQQVLERARAGTEGITRRRLLIGAAGAAGAGVAAAVAIPVAALGPGLEEQPARGVCDLAVSLAARPVHPVPWARAGVPLPLLHVRRARWGQRRVRPRGAAVAAAAARDRRGRCAARGGSAFRAGRPRMVGRPPVSADRDGTTNAVAFVDQRLGAARAMRFAMDYVFP